MDPIVNIMQIDVEDWYCDLEFCSWHSYTQRVARNTAKILSILQEHDVRATFFILGYIAGKIPELVQEIQNNGHEIASHGYAHRRITDQSPAEFEKDLVQSLETLEKITGEKIWGYRAPQFTLTEETAWAIDILKKHGLKYDSSIFPVKTPLYGVPGAPLSPYHIRSENIKIDHPDEEFLEIPLSVYQVPFIKKRIPVGGGIYLRVLPYPITGYSIGRINRSHRSAVCYLHPWELDSEKPRHKDLKWYHYYGIDHTEKKFRQLFKKFNFTSTRSWIENTRL